MANGLTDKSTLTDTVKTALSSSGLMPTFKNIVHADTATKDNDTPELATKVYAMVEDLQKMLDSGNLEDTDTQKLNSILTRLRGALQGGSVSREALVMALSEATIAIGAANSLSKSITLQQKTNQLWGAIEKHNQAIEDDFAKMRENGIVFDDKLWKKHEQLSEYMQTHPQDIEKQKELNAVDDQLLGQAELQLAKMPSAKPHLDHAKNESKERHQKVDHKLAEIQKKTDILNSCTDLDWEDVPSQKNSPSPVSSVKQNSSEKFVRKQTNLCLRTKLAQAHGFFTFLAMTNPFTIKTLLDSLSFIAPGSANKSVQR